MKLSLIESRLFGRICYGFKRDNYGFVEIVPEQAEVVKTIFRMYREENIYVTNSRLQFRTDSRSVDPLSQFRHIYFGRNFTTHSTLHVCGNISTGVASINSYPLAVR